MKNIYFILITLFSFSLGFGQTTTVYTQDFETLNSGYTASSTQGTVGSETDIFNRSNPNIGGNSTFKWAVEDTNATPASITLDEIDVTGYSDFTFFIDLLAHHYNDWDNSDEMTITYSIDDGPSQNLLWVRNSGGTFNEAASLDTDFDGVGDCGAGTLPALTTGTSGCSVTSNQFATFSSSTIALSGNSTLDIVIAFEELTSTDEGIYLDNIEVQATPSGPPAPTITATPNPVTGLGYQFNDLTSTIETISIEGTNLDNSDVILTLPTGSDFEIAETSGGTYSNSITLTTYDGSATDVFARLKIGLGENTYTDDISITGGGLVAPVLVTLNAEVTPIPPNNDDCANAIALVVNDPAVSGTLEASTFVTPFDKNDVWYSITPAYDETYTISVDNFSGDVDIFLFNQGSACPTTVSDIASSETASAIEEIEIALVSGTTYYLRVEAFNAAGENTFDILVTAPPQRDFDTEIYASITQVPISNQTAVDVTTSANSFAVLGFEIDDQGTSDGLPTEVTKMRFVPGPNNNVGWVDHIQGITLDDISNSYTPSNVSITDTEIILDFATPISINDATATEFELGVYLNTSNIVDGGVLQFQIDGTLSGFESSLVGSGFANPLLFGNVVGNNHIIDVEATQLSFLQQPTDVEVNTVMTPAVQVAYTDVNGNIDNFYTGTGADIALTTSGSFDALATTTVEAVDGVATFSDLIFDTLASSVNITATDDSGLITGTFQSADFDVLTAPIFPTAGELIITEVSDASDFNNEFIEIYNTTSTLIDMSTSKLVMQNDGTVWDFGDDIPNAVIPPNGFLIVTRGGTQTAFETEFGILNAQSVFVEGSGGMFFGTGSARSWQLYEGGTASTANGTLIDDTVNTVAGSGNRDFFDFLTDAYVTTSDTEANPGVNDNLVYESTAWKYNAKADATTGESNVYFQDNFTATEAIAFNDGEVSANVVLDLNTNDLSINSTLVFKSDDTGTAQFDEFTGTISGSGNVTVERYIPARRAFRFLSSAVSGQSIAGAWQQNTHITGTGGATNGFDPSSSNNPSMFTFDASAQGWLPLSTTSTVLEAGTAYRIMVRGDRTIDLLNPNANDETPNVTTLVARGNLATGDLTTGVDLPQLSQDASTTSPTEETKFSFVGNPYQAVVDASLLTYNGGVRSDFIVFWDPNLGDRGAFVQVELSTGSTILPTPAPTPSSTAASKFIMPGQAFFVGNASSVTTPSITFTEAAKATSQTQTSVFSTTNLAYLNLRLYTESAWSNNQPEQDALGIRWSSDYTTDVSTEDIVKLSNPDENIAVNNSNTLLGIDKRNLPASEEIIPLFINNYEDEDYVIFNQHENLPEGTILYLEDHYLGTTTLLANDEVYTYSVDANIPASTANSRFSIRFEVGTLSQEDFSANRFSMHPNPVENQLNLHVSEAFIDASVLVEVYDVLGRKMLQKEVMFLENTQQLEVSNLSGGMYILKMQHDGKVYSGRFIKM